MKTQNLIRQLADKVQNYNLKFKIFAFYIFILSFAFCILHFSFPVWAMPTPVQERVRLQENTTVQEEENRATTGGKLEEKIQQIREAVREKVRERVQEIRQGTPRGYFGEIKQIDNQEFILVTRREEIQVTAPADVKIIGKNRQNLEFKDLKAGNFCIAMGYLTENKTLEAKRIVLMLKPKPSLRVSVFGKVTDISEEEKILTVKNEKKGLTYTISASTKTTITKKGETKIEKVGFSAIEIGDRVIIVGTHKENEEKIVTAKIIHVIPGKVLGQEKPSASPTLQQ